VARSDRRNPPAARRSLGSLLLLFALVVLVVILTAVQWAQSGRPPLFTLACLGLVAVAALSLPLLPWVLGPILIRRTCRLPREVAFQTFDPDDPETPAVVKESIAATGRALAGDGFAPRAHLLTENESPHGLAFLTLFENRPARVLARLLTLYTGRGKALKRQTALVFSTEFADGTEIATNNTQTLSNSPPCPWRTIVNVPDVRDARELYRIHTDVVAHLSPRSAACDPVQGDPMGHQQAYTNRERARFVDCGYTYLDPDADCYRATWKGAVLMAWKLLWPVSAVRRARLRRRTEALLRACRGGGGGGI
jgi:hypothetical protein